MSKLSLHVSLWAAGVILYCCLFPSLLFSATKLRIGYSAITTTQAPLWAAQDRGIFTKYGIEPELIYLAGGSKIALALESNSIQMGRFNVSSAVDSRLAGGTLVVIGSFYDYYYFQIFGKPTFQRPADLKGKVIAASTAGSASDYGVREALQWGIRMVEEAEEPIHVKVRGHMKVRNRKGKPCPRCGGTIRREGVRGYDVFFCPTCQPPSRKLFIDWSRADAGHTPPGS